MADRFNSSSDEWLNFYNENGYVILTNLISESALDSAKRGCDKMIDQLADRLISKKKVSSKCESEPFEKRLITLCKGCETDLPNLFRNELHTEEFHPFLFDENLIAAVRRILNPNLESLRIYPNYTVRPKTPSLLHEVVWHQDAGLGSDGGPAKASVEERMDSFGLDSVVNCWSPLVPANARNGAMKFIPKSHKTGLLIHEKVGTYAGATGSGEKLDVNASSGAAAKIGAFITTINRPDMEKVEHLAIDIEMNPTDVVFFNNILVHRGGSNTSEGIRWSVDWRFQDASKPTHRDEDGHVCWRKKGMGGDVIQGPADWASRNLFS